MVTITNKNFELLDSKEKLEEFCTQLMEMDVLDSALLKWEFVEWASNNNWELYSHRISKYKESETLTFEIGSDNCKACKLYYNEPKGICRECPLKQFTGSECIKTWSHWSKLRNPKPMIEAIRQAINFKTNQNEEIETITMNLLETIDKIFVKLQTAALVFLSFLSGLVLGSIIWNIIK